MSVTIRKGTASQALTMTPLIDVVFLLLIFFLVATRFDDADRQLDVKLPSAEQAVPDVLRPSDLLIEMNEDGSCFIEGRQLDLPSVENVIRERVASNPTTQSVKIRADKRVTLQDVVSVMNICKQYGAEYSIRTE
ncbi:MAG: biopolymer transporter ExbD [Pirellulaceae bacterium]